MGPPLSKNALEQMLAEALDRYREHQKTGDDMADAGAELANRIEHLLDGPICGLPREELLRERAESKRRKRRATPPRPPSNDDYGYPDYR